MTMYVRDNGKWSTHKYVVCHPIGMPLLSTLECSRSKAIKTYVKTKNGDWSDFFAMGYRTKKVLLEVQPK